MASAPISQPITLRDLVAPLSSGDNRAYVFLASGNCADPILSASGKAVWFRGPGNGQERWWPLSILRFREDSVNRVYGGDILVPVYFLIRNSIEF